MHRAEGAFLDSRRVDLTRRSDDVDIGHANLAQPSQEIQSWREVVRQ
jgi:hypothetical protein